MATNARAGLKNIYTGVHVTDLDDLIHVHIVVTADAAELVGKGNVHGTVGVLYHLSHFSRANVGNDDFALAERGIVLLYLLTNLLAVSTNGTVVMEQLIDHVAGNDTLRSVNQIDVLTNLKSVFLNHWAYELVNGSGTNGRFNNYGSTLGAHLHHFLDGSYYIAGINLLGELVVRSRNTDNIHVCLLVLGGELNTCLNGIGKELVKTVFFEGGLASIQRIYQLLVVVGTNYFNSV